MKNFSYTLTVFILIYSGTIGVFAQTGIPTKMEPMGEEGFKVLSDFYKYDKNVPLDYKLIRTADFEHFTREKFVFTGHNRRKVPAFLAIPKTGKGTYPLICVMHGGGSHKNIYWPDGSAAEGHIARMTQELIKSGYAVLMLDALYYGERSNADYHDHTVPHRPGNEILVRDVIIHSTIDYRRAFDYLETRDDIDMSRVGSYGRSLGSMMSLTLGSMDERVKVMMPFALPTNIYDQQMGDLQQVEKVLAPWHYYHGLKGKYVYFVYSKKDPLNSPGDVGNLYKLFESDKTQSKVYEWDCGHCSDPTDSQMEEWVEWFKENL